MEIVRGSKDAKMIAGRWKNQYQKTDGTWKSTAYGDTQKVHSALLKCRNSRAQINSVIGNEGWTNIFCGSCHEYRESAIKFKSEDSPVCEDCLRKGISLIRAR